MSKSIVARELNGKIYYDVTNDKTDAHRIYDQELNLCMNWSKYNEPRYEEFDAEAVTIESDDLEVMGIDLKEVLHSLRLTFVREG